MATVYGSEANADAVRRTRRRRAPGLRSGPTHTDGHNSSPARGPASVNSLIEEQIIPRLLLAHSSGVPKGRVTGTL